MQEMLHFVQAANILIAVGGEIKIDDRDFVPSYPVTGLPGGMLPGLKIYLENCNLEHVYRTFMAIEVPSPPENDTDDTPHTIGVFYKEIEKCIDSLSSEIDLFGNPKVNDQVKWPWHKENRVGTVHIITDTQSAKNGIDEIIEQGEGAGHLDPNQIDDGL